MGIWEDGVPGITDRLCTVQIKQNNIVCLGDDSRTPQLGDERTGGCWEMEGKGSPSRKCRKLVF